MNSLCVNNVVAVLLFCLIPCRLYAQAEASPAFTADELIAPPSLNWVTNGGNLANQRYSPLNQINRDNVAELKAEWRVHMNGSGSAPNHSGQAQPLSTSMANTSFSPVTT